MSFMVSPGVQTHEIDLTTVVGTGVSTSVGAFAGNYTWGPCNQRVLLVNEIDLVNIFGKPTKDNYVDFFTAANFLSYTTALWVERIADSNTSNHQNATSGSVSVRVNNDTDYHGVSLTASLGAWIARYPGTKGNSLAVAAIDSAGTLSANITITGNTAGAWNQYFSHLPNTSSHASSLGGSNDELHILVIDEDGLFTGTKGTILESFAHVSKSPGAKQEDGTNNYYVDIINQSSQYVRIGGTYVLGSLATGKISDTWTPTGTNVVSLSKGSDLDLASVTDEYVNGMDMFSNPEDVDVSLVLTGAANLVEAQNAIDICQNRKDCVAFISPQWSHVQVGLTASQIASNVVNYKNNNSTGLNRSSSYYVMDSGWKYQYDNYNDLYRWIPLNGDIAGLCARTDQTNDAWWSPAGFNRGNIQFIIKLAWNPNQAQRDLLYQAGVNPVVSFPGEGTILYGDKTGLAKPSAFDRINVRRLFIILEKTISRAAKYSLFEFNDEFTRAQFRTMVEPFLRAVKGRRGIYDFIVICDASNNTPQVIDSNEFVGDIYIKPARSINYINLNFIAVSTGVAFNEVIGKW